MTAFDKEKTAFAVGSSESGKREQVLMGLVSGSSIPEGAEAVKDNPENGGLGYAQARRLAVRLTPRQRRDIVRLALVIQEAGT